MSGNTLAAANRSSALEVADISLYQYESYWHDRLRVDHLVVIP